jgi:hypothetical protein
MAALYDKNRRQIHAHDVLKVFHFTGARNKKYYMYKQAVCIVTLGKHGTLYWKINHLERSGGHYHEIADDRVLSHYEIVQGFGPGDLHFEDRPKLSPPTNEE